MDYERKYKEALEKAKVVYHDHRKDKYWQDWLTELFPELEETESEDEKIRKAIIAYISHGQHCGVSNADMIAWLEKQGEKNINHIDIKEKAHQIAWEASKNYDPSLSKESWCEMAALDMASWLEKQDKKKSADNVWLQNYISNVTCLVNQLKKDFGL